MPFEKVVRQYTEPFTRKKYEKTIYFCKNCGQGFDRPKKHHLDINETEKCK